MVRISNRWHRVYVVNYGNSGSSYVIREGRNHYLSPGAELIVETVRDGGTAADAISQLQEWPDWMRSGEGM
jgi:hypothetical protein